MSANELTALPPCPICGKPIPWKVGMPRKTCSDECRKVRASRKEALRYERVKGTEEWKETRAHYIERITNRAKTDEIFAKKLAHSRRAAVRRHRDLINSIPARRELLLASKRDAWRIRATPDQRAAWREQNRAWYRSLSNVDRARIYYAPRAWRRYKEGFVERIEAAAAHFADQASVNKARAVQSYRHWETWEIEFLRSRWGDTDAREIGKVVRRTTKAIWLMAMRLGLKAVPGRGLGGGSLPNDQRSPWTEFQIRALREFRSQYTLREISDAMGRSLQSVKSRSRLIRAK